MMDHLIKMNKWQPYRQTSGGRFFQKGIEIHFSSREKFLANLNATVLLLELLAVMRRRMCREYEKAIKIHLNVWMSYGFIVMSMFKQKVARRHVPSRCLSMSQCVNWQWHYDTGGSGYYLIGNSGWEILNLIF